MNSRCAVKARTTALPPADAITVCHRTAWRMVKAALVTLGLTSCSTVPSMADREMLAQQLAATRGWEKQLHKTSTFSLRAWSSPKQSASTLSIYIEGDGFAWVNGATPSSDPTPTHPIGLRLALAQPTGASAYLARPCQYVAPDVDPLCQVAHWTDARFGSQVIAATNEAIDALKRQHHAQNVVLVGYSGGAAVAALVANRRTDVVALVTLAGNLDHALWTRLHGVQGLRHSGNPAQQPPLDIPQWHFAGAKDRIVPTEVIASYVRRQPHTAMVTFRTFENFDHACCWVQAWPDLWSTLGIDQQKQ